MNEVSSFDRKYKSFLVGAAISFVLSVPLVGMFYAFRGISEQKATGLGAVAGGLAEWYITLGLILGFALPVAGIVLLIKSFSWEHWLRNFFSLLCIAWNTLMLTLAGLFVWLSFK